MDTGELSKHKGSYYNGTNALYRYTLIHKWVYIMYSTKINEDKSNTLESITKQLN